MTPILPIRLMSRKIVPKQDSIGLSHDYGELYYSLHGVMELMIDGQHYIAPKHHCIWLPPNTWHYCICQNEVHFLTLHIDPIWAKALSDKVCVLTVSSLMQSVLGYLHNQPQDRLDIPSNQRLLQVAYDQLLQASSSDNYLPGSNDPMIAPILDLFNTNLADDKSLKQLAKIVNTTERTLMRRAIKSLGMSLMEWKLRLRVVKATAMLNQGFSVERTALELGYSSSSAFISMFRKLMGVTPGEFRHQRRA